MPIRQLGFNWVGGDKIEYPSNYIIGKYSKIFNDTISVSV